MIVQYPNNTHRLLLRQIRKTILHNCNDATVTDLLKLVNDAYFDFDESRTLHMRAESISNRELSEVNKQLSTQNNFLNSFNHGLAHDVKNHTSNILGLIEMQKKYISKQNFEMISEINEKLELSAKLLSSIVQGFLMLSRSSAVIEDNYLEIDEAKLKIEILNETQILTKNKSVDIQFNFQLKNLIFSPQILKIIFVNLISNSIKYSSNSKTVYVHASLQHINNKLLLIVKDNGNGMDLKANNNKLFNLFTQFGSFEKGYGIGLYMIKNIVEKLNGKIEVESELEKGTTIKIEFNITHTINNEI